MTNCKARKDNKNHMKWRVSYATSACQRRATPGAVPAGPCDSTPSWGTEGARLRAGAVVHSSATRGIAVCWRSVASAIVGSCKEKQSHARLAITTSTETKNRKRARHTSACQRSTAPAAVIAGACGRPSGWGAKVARLRTGASVRTKRTRCGAVGGGRICSAIVRGCTEAQITARLD